MINIAVSKGNSKLGKLPNINLPPGPEWSCREDVPCAVDCYAMKAWRQYPATRAAWTRNWDLWTTDPASFETQLQSYLTASKPKRFRWHSSGDIPDQKYFDMMVRIADANPKTRFLAFTKRYEFDLECDCLNLSVVYSRWPGYAFPDHLKDKGQAHFTDGDDTSLEPEDEADACPGSCVKCSKCWVIGLGMKAGNVSFTKH
jgi:hypothetical protein